MWIYPADTGKTQEAAETKTNQTVNDPPYFHFSEDGVKAEAASRRRQDGQGITPIPHPEKTKVHQEKEAEKNVLPHKEERVTKYDSSPCKVRNPVRTVRLFAALYALGALMAGVMRAALSEESLSFLNAFLQKLSVLNSVPPFELFAVLFITAFLQITLVAFMSFCAFGIPLMAVFIVLCGIGAGLPAVALLLENGISGTIFYLFCWGVYHAAVAAAICFLAQTGAPMAEQLFYHAFSAPGRKCLDIKTDTAGFCRRYLYTIVLLILLCGLCAATAGIAGELLLG